ncbi:MAG TPA: C25 family cysteine peptidase, partial [Pirellulaceae bacterium]
GPIAAVCGSRVTTPYAMTIFASGLLDAYFQRRLPTLGEVVLHAKRVLANPELDPSPNRKLLNSLAKTFSPTKDNLPGERDEHQWLLNLLGDPMLRLPYPEPIRVDCPRHTTASETIRIAAELPVGGECLVELVCRRDLSTRPVVPRHALETDDESLRQMMEGYWAVNDKRWAARRVSVRPGPLVVELSVPEGAAGSCFARVAVMGDVMALGSAPIYVQAREADPLSKPNASR